MTEQISSKLNAQLQCPKCRQPLERLTKTFRCPSGHVELNITTEGYTIIKELNDFIKPLLYGGDFPEGLHWERVLRCCEKVVYVTAEEEGEDDLRPLQHHLMARSKKFSAVPFRELRMLKVDGETPIIFNHRIRRMNRWIIMLRYLRHPIYIYISGIIVRLNFVRLVRQKITSILNKYIVIPITSKGIETRYNKYLYDKTTANEFASNYLPEALRNGSSREAFDIGCGRGRHVAMLNQLGFAVTGMDIQSHPYWSRIPEPSFVLGTTDCLSYIPGEVFDLVVCMQVLMYLFDDDTILSHIRRMLKGEGYLLLQVTNAENLHTTLTKQPLAEDPYLQRYYKQSELCNKLAQNGFKIVRIWTEKFYTPFFVLPGNILYEFILNQPLKRFWDKLVPPQHLGLINILAHAA